MRNFKLAGMLSVVLLAVPSLAWATVYDAFDDFDTVTPANSDTTTWSYRYDDQYPTTRAAAPALHTQFTPAFPGKYNPGPDNYSWNSYPAFGQYYPGIAINDTGLVQTFYGVLDIPVDTLWTAPLIVTGSGPQWSGGMSVLSWLAREAGVYDVEYSFTMLETGGNGIQYFVDQHAASLTNLATGTVGPTAGNSTGVLTVAGVHVNAGDRINFVLDSLSNNSSADTSAFSARVTNVSPPPGRYSATVLGDGPIGYWRLGEVVGPTAFDRADASGAPQFGAQDGTYGGTGWLGTPGAIWGDPDTALTLVSGQVSIAAGEPGNTVFDFGVNDPFTMEAWINTSTASTELEGIVSKYDGPAGKGYYMALFNPGVADPDGWQLLTAIQSGNNQAYKWTDSMDNLADGQWHHVVVTHAPGGTADSLTLFVDGAEITTTVSDSPGGAREVSSMMFRCRSACGSLESTSTAPSTRWPSTAGR